MSRWLKYHPNSYYAQTAIIQFEYEELSSLEDYRHLDVYNNSV
ncbi:protein of unknown function [Vibrio tapetis subsp. tapetis]|uniref:Uncharacterized protein n=1 Tax=Vibrio tapetis subsp. tapetis TaxID=1671868 RepID=A0A2N8ZAG5_9VIBR|nr:protein of unknown function [Vibrio tapetis subsp. tapetis]